MSDHIAALEAALHTEAMNLPLEVLFGVLAEVKRLREELAASEARADMHADLGRRTAEALGIPLEKGRSHMPEVAQRMRAENEALRRPLSEQKIVECIAAAGCLGTVKMSYDSGPYEITRTTVNSDRFARAIRAAHIEAAEKAGKERT